MHALCNAVWNTKLSHAAATGIMFQTGRELQDTRLISHETADGIGAHMPTLRQFCNRVMLIMSDTFIREIIGICTTGALLTFIRAPYDWLPSLA